MPVEMEFIPGAIVGAFMPEWLRIVALLVGVIVVLFCSVMVAADKKPGFSGETFGYACKLFMRESLEGNRFRRCGCRRIPCVRR